MIPDKIKPWIMIFKKKKRSKILKKRLKFKFQKYI